VRSRTRNSCEESQGGTTGKKNPCRERATQKTAYVRGEQGAKRSMGSPPAKERKVGPEKKRTKFAENEGADRGVAA